jgi:hypothetical protein
MSRQFFAAPAGQSLIPVKERCAFGAELLRNVAGVAATVRSLEQAPTALAPAARMNATTGSEGRVHEGHAA